MMHRYSIRALARLRVTGALLPLPIRITALLIPLSGIGYVLGYPTLAGGLIAAAVLLLVNAGIDRAMIGSDGHE